MKELTALGNKPGLLFLAIRTLLLSENVKRSSEWAVGHDFSEEAAGF